VPLRAGVILEREPAELDLAPTLVLVVAVGGAEKTEVSETEDCEFALDLLYIDVLVLDDEAGAC